MMRWLRRLLCRVFGHQTLPAVKVENSLLYYCPRCASMQLGHYAVPRRKAP
jgi:hypothetical protein